MACTAWLGLKRPAPATARFIVHFTTRWNVSIRGLPRACSNRGFHTARCEFQVRPGASFSLVATAGRKNPYAGQRAGPTSEFTPGWTGCDRTSQHHVESQCSIKVPSPGRLVCVSTEDPAEGGSRAVCEGLERRGATRLKYIPE
jgi:hypothetical protein